MANKKLRCIVVDDEAVSREIILKFIQKTDFLSNEGGFESAIDAVTYLRDNEVDILFLDVEMPEMSGMELIKTLKVKPKIVLITGSEKYAIDAFEHEVSDYLLKPVVYARFLKAVSKLREQDASDKEEKAGANHIFLKVESRLIKVNLQEIDFIEAMGDYIQVTAGQKKYMVHSTLAAMDEKLNNPHFLRVHRSYIVNLEKIVTIEDNTLIVASKVIPVGTVYREELMKRLNIA